MPPSADVISRAQDEDQFAKEEILDHYLGLIKSIAKRMSRRPSDVEDLISEGCLALFEELPRFNPSISSDFSGFVFFRVTRRLMDYLRRENRYFNGKVDLPFPLDEIPAAENPGRGAVEDILASITEEERELLEYYFGVNRGEMSSSEIGEAVGLSPSWIRVKVSHLLKSIREASSSLAS